MKSDFLESWKKSGFVSRILCFRHIFENSVRSIVSVFGPPSLSICQGLQISDTIYAQIRYIFKIVFNGKLIG